MMQNTRYSWITEFLLDCPNALLRDGMVPTCSLCLSRRVSPVSTVSQPERRPERRPQHAPLPGTQAQFIKTALSNVAPLEAKSYTLKVPAEEQKGAVVPVEEPYVPGQTVLLQTQADPRSLRLFSRPESPTERGVGPCECIGSTRPDLYVSLVCAPIGAFAWV
jgi:hypothetical protein